MFNVVPVPTWKTGAHENGENHTQATFHIRPSNGGGKQEVRGSAVPANEWVHLVGVWDGGKLHIYVNGKLDNSADAAGPPVGMC